jgi:hypothetical protein
LPRKKKTELKKMFAKREGDKTNLLITPPSPNKERIEILSILEYRQYSLQGQQISFRIE